MFVTSCKQTTFIHLFNGSIRQSYRSKAVLKIYPYTYKRSAESLWENSYKNKFQSFSERVACKMFFTSERSLVGFICSIEHVACWPILFTLTHLQSTSFKSFQTVSRRHLTRSGRELGKISWTWWCGKPFLLVCYYWIVVTTIDTYTRALRVNHIEAIEQVQKVYFEMWEMSAWRKPETESGKQLC